MRITKDCKIQGNGDRTIAIFSVGGTYISCDEVRRKFHAIAGHENTAGVWRRGREGKEVQL